MDAGLEHRLCCGCTSATRRHIDFISTINIILALPLLYLFILTILLLNKQFTMELSATNF